MTCLASNLSAEQTYAQQTLISVTIENRTIKEAFKEIERNSGFVIFYYEGIIDSKKKVKLSAKNQTIDKILDQLLKNTNSTYKIVDKQIYITQKKTEDAQQQQQQQSGAKKRKNITGKVLDTAGDPLPGASILVQGDTRGVTTDMDGQFSIDVTSADKLMVSFIGMDNQIISIDGKTELVVVLKEKTDLLDEVTVVAFAKQKKESVIASISTIKPAELKAPSSNFTSSLAGRIAGVISYQTSGEPGQDNAQFFVRGITSFGADSKKDPLILIDNIEMNSNDLARLQPDDIASFSIMKDATAAALYGSRGANGVILVTTKEGKEGKAVVSIRFETSLSQPTEMIKLADPITYMKLHNEAIKTRNPLGILPYSENKIANTIAGANPMVYPANDWYNMMFKDYTINERLNFSVSGGGKVARYYLSGTYNQDH